MSMDAASSTGIFSQFEQLRFAREILRTEGQAVLALADSLHDDFCRGVDLLYHCRGNVIVTGMGKAGLIGQKIAATLGSTGTSSHFLHPGEAIHGDLGRIHAQDIALALSIGISIGTYSSIYVAAPFTEWMDRRVFRKLV